LSQAFTVAATAVASGVEVSLWLTGEASWMAVPGRAEAFELPYAAPLAELRDAVLVGGRLTVCTQCAARRGLTEDDLVPGAVIRGAAAFVEEVTAPGAQALVY
jgi:predicted peroxiredoxin